jgi:hypothetical protein
MQSRAADGRLAENRRLEDLVMSHAAGLLCCFILAIAADKTSADESTTRLWQDFQTARTRGAATILPDFSYAGYRFSERPLPDVSERAQFDVTAYGARPDDEEYDEAGIQAAVDAAESASGGVVYFPAGNYLIAPIANGTAVSESRRAMSS